MTYCNEKQHYAPVDVEINLLTEIAAISIQQSKLLVKFMSKRPPFSFTHTHGGST